MTGSRLFTGFCRVFFAHETSYIAMVSEEKQTWATDDFFFRFYRVFFFGNGIFRAAASTHVVSERLYCRFFSPFLIFFLRRTANCGHSERNEAVEREMQKRQSKKTQTNKQTKRSSHRRPHTHTHTHTHTKDAIRGRKRINERSSGTSRIWRTRGPG